METATNNTSGTLLGRMVQERLMQLGVSRRQFCIANKISRQTLYEVEHQGKVNLMPSSLMAIDTGLHWEPGTAARLASGDANAIAITDVAERVDQYVRTIVDQISRMTLAELERESIWLEEELFGRAAQNIEESIGMIRDAFRKIIPTLDQEVRTPNVNTERKREGRPVRNGAKP